MPSKALIHCAEHFGARKHFGSFGISGAEGLSVDDVHIMNRVRAFRDRFTKGVQSFSTDSLKETQLIKGYAKFVSENQVEVNGELIQAERFIIATGSRPVMPKPWREMGDKVITSDEVFELTHLPKSIAVVGLGIIGLEIGMALSKLGVEVHGFEMAQTLAGLSSPEVIESAVEIMGKEFPLHLGVAAELTDVPEGVSVSSGSTSIVVEKGLASMGRRPNIDQIGIECLGVPMDDRGMPLFDIPTMQIADKPIFIAGDVNGFRPILHEAGHEGTIAVKNAMSYPNVQSYRRKTPLGIAFTDPQVGFFGQSYSQLDSEQTVVFNFNLEKNNGRAIVMNEDRGMISLYADKITKELIGGELFMHNAEHMTHLLTWAVEQRMTLLQLVRMPYYHPVLEEAVENGLAGLAKALYTEEELDSIDVL